MYEKTKIEPRLLPFDQLKIADVIGGKTIETGNYIDVAGLRSEKGDN